MLAYFLILLDICLKGCHAELRRSMVGRASALYPSTELRMTPLFNHARGLSRTRPGLLLCMSFLFLALDSYLLLLYLP